MKTKITIILTLLFATTAFAGIENAKFVHHRNLAATMQSLSSTDTWVAYEIPSPNNRAVMCCFDNWNHNKPSSAGTCRLGKGASYFTGTISGTNVKIDTSTTIVTLHTKRGSKRDIGLFSGGCTVDAGGMTVHLIDDVSVEESLQYFEGLAERRSDQDEVFAAIAMHDSPRVPQILERFTTSGNDIDTRGQAIFWLAQVGGHRGFEVARRLAIDDPNREMRKKAVFALTQSDDPQVFDTLATIVRTHIDAETRSDAVFWFGQEGGQRALPVLRERVEQETGDVREKAIFAISQVEGEEATQTLISLARNHRDAEVRKKALFWLGQQAERKITSVLRDALDNDPDSEVREAAVFAISQRPANEAIPALIGLATTHRDPNVRKKAVFWLSQIDDSRAVEAIERILTGK